MNFKNCENNDLRKHLCKLEAKLSVIKSYVNCKISISTNKTESISNNFERRINTLQEKEKSRIEILQQNMTFLQNELLSKNEIKKWLIEIQSSALYTMQKSSSTSENCMSPNVNHSIIYNLSPSNVTFIHVFNNLKINYTNNKIMRHKNMMNYAKTIEHSNTSSSKTNWVSCL